jgi:hypothetical protein
MLRLRLFYCAMLWLSCSSRARAAEPSASIQLRYSAPADCPDRATVLRAIDNLLQSNENFDRTLKVVAIVEPRDVGEYALKLQWTSDDGAGERNIDAESCEAAADAAAWLIASAIKRAALPQPAEQSAHAEPVSLRYELAVHATGAFGILPGTALGGNLSAGLAWSSFHASLSFGYFPAKEVKRGNATVDFDLAEVGLDACYLVAGDRVAIGPCARAAVGRIGASSRGLNTPTTGDGRFQMFAVAVQLRVRLTTSFWLASDAALAWHQRRPVFVLSDADTLQQAHSVGLRLGLGIVLTVD